MKSNRTTNAVIILIFFIAVVVFGFVYNSTVTKTVDALADDDKQILSGTCEEISDRLATVEKDKWLSIIEEYDGIHAEIRDENNAVVLKTLDRFDDIYGVKIRNIFKYNNKTYLLSITAFLFRNTDISVAKYIVIEVLIWAFGLALACCFIYVIMIRPYRKFYKSIEEYDETGELKKVKLHGYTGRVYDRFWRMAVNHKRDQENQQRIIASISHDIKTPLTSIMGYSERLKNSDLSPERQNRYIDIIYNKSKDISSIVDGFDEYLGFKLKNQLFVEEFNLEQIKSLIIRDYADELEQNGVEFTIICKNKRKVVNLDESKIKRVFSNIISNSLKHIKSEEKQIKVEISCMDETVYIKFSDNGEGVPTEKLETIFDPLYTSDEGRKVAGLGLSICREIIEKHGGLIYAEPSPLGGLTVVIELKQTL